MRQWPKFVQAWYKSGTAQRRSVLAVVALNTGLIAPVIAPSIAYTPYIARVIRSMAVHERHPPHIETCQILGYSSSRRRASGSTPRTSDVSWPLTACAVGILDAERRANRPAPSCQEDCCRLSTGCRDDTHNRHQQAWTVLYSDGLRPRSIPGPGRCWTSWPCFASKGLRMFGTTRRSSGRTCYVIMSADRRPSQQDPRLILGCSKTSERATVTWREGACASQPSTNIQGLTLGPCSESLSSSYELTRSGYAHGSGTCHGSSGCGDSPGCWPVSGGSVMATSVHRTERQT
jgi:hypothetical protein